MDREILLAVAVIACVWCLHRARTTGGVLMYLPAAFWGIFGVNQWVRSRSLSILSIVLLALYWGLGFLRERTWKGRRQGLQKGRETGSEGKVIEIEVEEVRGPK